IETRSMLRSPHAQIFSAAHGEGIVIRLLHGAMAAVSTIGTPDAATLASALEGATPMTPVIAQVDSASHVAQLLKQIAPAADGRDWSAERMLFHTLGDNPAIAPVDPGVVIRLLAGSDSLDHLPRGLRHEITHARLSFPTGAAFVDGLPVSFCYPCFASESLWDVSIDTLETHRGRGLAAQLARFMIDPIREQALGPALGA